MDYIDDTVCYECGSLGPCACKLSLPDEAEELRRWRQLQDEIAAEALRLEAARTRCAGREVEAPL